MKKFVFSTLVLTILGSAIAVSDYNFGLKVGEKMSLPPVVEKTYGKALRKNTPKFLLTMNITNCFGCEKQAFAVFNNLAKRFPEIDFIIVDYKSLPKDVEKIWNKNYQFSLLLNGSRSFQKVLLNNVGPVIFITNHKGVVVDKLFSLSSYHLNSIDSELEDLANKKDVSKYAYEALVVGKKPNNLLGLVNVNKDVIIFHNSIYCDICDAMKKTDFYSKLRDFAIKNSDTDIIILEALSDKKSDFDQAKIFKDKYGFDYYTEMERNFRNLSYPKNFSGISDLKWPKNVKLVTYQKNGKQDIERWWGKSTYPNVMIFKKGLFVGPYPVWKSGFDYTGFNQTVREILNAR